MPTIVNGPVGWVKLFAKPIILFRQLMGFASLYPLLRISDPERPSPARDPGRYWSFQSPRHSADRCPQPAFLSLHRVVRTMSSAPPGAGAAPLAALLSRRRCRRAREAPPRAPRP